jgi:hypothetical protein
MSVRVNWVPGRLLLLCIPPNSRPSKGDAPRFEQTSELFQPRPLAAIELIKEEPIRLVEGRVDVSESGVPDAVRAQCCRAPAEAGPGRRRERRLTAMVGPRFEQTSELFQPRPLAAIELIKEEPIRLVEVSV